MSDSVVIEAREVRRVHLFGRVEMEILRGVDLKVHRGESLALVGPSGAGKTTFLQILGGMDRPTSGSVLFRGRDLAQMRTAELAAFRNRHVGFVFQFYHLYKDLNALENVLLPRMVGQGVLEWLRDRGPARDWARELLARVGLTDRERHRPAQLSGGERQRVAIARALVNRPELLLCDEPTGNLDRRTGETILDLLWTLRAELGQTFIIVTHDESLARRADSIVRMVDGQVDSAAA